MSSCRELKKKMSVTTLFHTHIFKKKGNKTMDWMLVAGNIFSVETRISDYLFSSWSAAW